MLALSRNFPWQRHRRPDKLQVRAYNSPLMGPEQEIFGTTTVIINVLFKMGNVHTTDSCLLFLYNV